MHLADFDTNPEEIEVYCEDHLPEDRTDGVVWLINDERASDLDGKRIFVRCLTRNAKKNWGGNCFNGSNKFVELFGVEQHHDDE